MKRLKTSQRLLLVLAVVNFLIGIPVTLTHIGVSPVWTVALPVGVVCLGLFLLSCIWHNEMVKFDEEERLRIVSGTRRGVPNSETTTKSRLKALKLIWPCSPEAGPPENAACNSTKTPVRTAAREIT